MLNLKYVAIAAGLGAIMVAGGCGQKAAKVSSDDRQRLEAFGERQATEPKVLAVAMHADWCGTCQTLGPRLMEAAGPLEARGVQVVKADHTSRTDPQAESTLTDIGLGDLYAKNGGKTGVVYLVDADSGAVLDEIRGANHSVEQIATKLTGALAEAG
ncbi:MAG: thioredoxin domain-containing protein [Planctomycetota bacterium]